MAKVFLKQNWFAPDGQTYRGGAGTGTVDIPDHLCVVNEETGKFKFLPSTAVVDDGRRVIPARQVAPMMNIRTAGLPTVTTERAAELASAEAAKAPKVETPAQEPNRDAPQVEAIKPGTKKPRQ